MKAENYLEVPNGVFTRSDKRLANVQLHYNIWQQMSSKLPANVQQFTCILNKFAWSLLDVC